MGTKPTRAKGMLVAWGAARSVMCLAVSWALFVSSPAPLQAQAATDAIFARVRSSDFEGALTLLKQLPPSEAAQVELRYLAARLHEKAGRLPEALAAMPTAPEGLPPEVAKDAQRRRALWLARTEQCAVALPSFEALLPGSTSDTTLVFAASECAIARKDYVSALAYLQKLGATAEQSVPAQLLRARALSAKGERSAAITVLRELCLKRPGHARTAEAQRMLERLSPKLQWTDDERMQRAAALTDALKPQDAIAELDRLRAPKAKTVRARALHLRGMALFQMRTRYAEAAKIFDLAAKQGGPDAASDAYHHARALARADRDADAVKAYRAFIKRYPESGFVSDATYAAAWLELRHDLPGGEAHMRAHLAAIEKKGNKEALQTALWDLAYHLFEHGEHDKALPLFERYANTTTDAAMVRGRGFYWAGRAALLAGKRDQAVAHFRAALKVEPLHWYHVLARKRLLDLAQMVGDPFDETRPAAEPLVVAGTAAVATAAPPAPEPIALPLPAAVTFYMRLGLQDDALSALRDSESAMRASVAKADGLLALVATYHALDEHARPYRLVEREGLGVLSQKPAGIERALWDALFPRPYRDHVVSASTGEQLPEDFVYSIMRKESAYDPTVVSSADAMGLLQLIEPTARTMAKQIGISSFTRAQAFIPATNIRLGSHYLSKLRALYKGQYVPAIAAYNAGEHRVNGWLVRASKRNGERIELDRFVEEIPFEQTRNYVRRVIANWVRYRYLQDPATWPLELPEHVQP